MSRSERLLELLQLLRSYRYPVTASRLADELEDPPLLVGPGVSFDQIDELLIMLRKAIRKKKKVHLSYRSVDGMREKWRATEIPIVLEPTALDFGYGFVALDPDGHRVRIFTPTTA